MMSLKWCVMKFSIVVPCYRHPQLANQILMDIYQNCSADEVIIVDDFSNDEETKKVYEFWQRLGEAFPLKVLYLPENVGFVKASNAGLKEATGDIVALISSDVRIYKDLKRFSREIFTTPHDKILLGGRLLDFDTGWNVFNGQTYSYVEGWALITTRSGWEELGYMDERYAPWDFEDVDLSTTAVSKGYMLRVFPPWHGEVMEHMVAQSIGYTDERRTITEAHRELFRKKWSNVVNP